MESNLRTTAVTEKLQSAVRIIDPLYLRLNRYVISHIIRVSPYARCNMQYKFKSEGSPNNMKIITKYATIYHK